MLGDIEYQVAQLMDYTTPRISIKLLVIIDLDNYGNFSGRWQSVSRGMRRFSKFHKVIMWPVGERRRT